MTTRSVTTAPNVLIIIVTWNKKQYVLELLASLVTLDYPNYALDIIGLISTRQLNVLFTKASRLGFMYLWAIFPNFYGAIWLFHPNPYSGMVTFSSRDTPLASTTAEFDKRRKFLQPFQ